MSAAPAAPAHPAHDPLAMKRAGLWLFFFSECVLFGLLMSTRFFLEGIQKEHLNQLLGLGITVILVTSSTTAYMAETSMELGRRKSAIWFIVATIALGLLFAFGVGFEWATAEFSRHEAFGTVFFTMTGVHASHVMSGVGLLVLLLVQLLRGRFSEKDHWPVSGVIMYWHFVDIVWVFFYPTLYLV